MAARARERKSGSRGSTSPLSRPPLSPALVRCGAVDRREQDVVEAEVHAELPAMMDEMVDVCAHHGAARHGHEDTVAMLERPDHREVGVLSSSERLAGGADVLVELGQQRRRRLEADRKSTRLNSSHLVISYAVFCLKKKK